MTATSQSIARVCVDCPLYRAGKPCCGEYTKPATSQEKRSAVVTIRCRCVLCKHKQDVDPSKVDELGPSCEKCLGPMVVEQAEVRRDR